MTFDYAALKDLSRLTKVPVRDLIALAPANDPYYANVASRARDAQWFAEQWHRLRFGAGMHLRRGHYILVSQQEPILKPNGEPYENTDSDWKYLVSASLSARYLNLIPADHIVDRRNEAPQVYTPETKGTPGPDITIDLNNLFWPELPELPYLPEFSTEGFQRDQDYIAEVWIEKSTMNDILEPLCKRLGIDLIVGAGEMSETSCRHAVQRAIQRKKPVRIIYVSDFDPAGRSMPNAVSRKIEFYARQHEPLDITLTPIALLPEQCDAHRLPRVPIKESERRGRRFEERFGAGATELDALEAIVPGELARLVEAEVRRWIDPQLAARVQAVDRDVQRGADRIAGKVHDRFAPDIEALQALYREASAEVEALRDQTEALWERIAAAMEAETPDVSGVEVPAPDIVAQHDADPLFDTKRDYLTQLDHYRRWKGQLHEGGA